MDLILFVMVLWSVDLLTKYDLMSVIDIIYIIYILCTVEINV